MKKTKCLALIARQQQKRDKIFLAVGRAVYSLIVVIAFLAVAFLVMGIDSLTDFIIK